MKSEKGQNEIARSIYEGVKDYSAYVLETRRAEEEAAAAPKPGKEPETQVVIGKEPVRPAKQDKASDAPAAKAATPEKGEPEKAAGKSGAQKPAKAGDAPNKPPGRCVIPCRCWLARRPCRPRPHVQNPTATK